MTRTTVEIAADIGVTYRQLDHWCRTGLLNVDNPGSGRGRDWPAAELAAATRMARLVRAGLTPAAAARVAHGEQELAPGVRVQVTG